MSSYWWGRPERIAAVVAAACVVVALIGSIAWGGVRATEADRRWRAARAEVCRSIADEGTRVACIVGGRP